MTTSVESRVAAVVDYGLGDDNVSLAYLVAYASAIYRADGTTPAHHATAFAVAEDAIGVEGAEIIANWLDHNATAIEHGAAALDALRELAAPREVPAAALAAAGVAELLAAAAGDTLAEIIWAGACTTVQWCGRYTADETLTAEVRVGDPVVNAARWWLRPPDCARIATGIRLALAEIDALASGDYHRDSDGSGLNRNDCGGGLAGA